MTLGDDQKPEATLLICLGEYALQRQAHIAIQADVLSSTLV